MNVVANGLTPAMLDDAPARRWFGRKPRGPLVMPVILSGYETPNVFKNHRRALIVAFGIFAFFYGAAFALYGTYVLLQLLIPIFVMMILSIWLLPVTNRAPVGMLGRLLITFVVVVICWPNYLAVALPGMPWITMIRLVAVPLAVAMLLSISVSVKFRAELKTIMDAVPPVWKMLVVFIVIAFATIFVSKDVENSVNKFVVSQLYWTLIFFASCYAFAVPGRALRTAYILWICAIIVCALGVQEWRHKVVPWAGHIPSFLKVDDETLASMLSSKARKATGIYRVKSVFSTPLGLSEYLALATPFIVHIFATDKRIFIKVLAFASIPLIFYVLTTTDSRLGMVGFFLTFMLYLFAWGFVNMRDHPKRLAGRIVVFTYPVVAVAFLTLSFFWKRLHVMLWGGGATNPSTEARKAQVREGMPMIFQHPWGHGIGQGGATLHHANAAGKFSIDTYYLLIGLEYGIVGFIVYYGMFVSAIYYGARSVVAAKTPETRMLVPLLIALINFTIIKSVFSQESNHPIVFALLGMLVALVYRVNGTSGRSGRLEGGDRKRYDELVRTSTVLNTG